MNRITRVAELMTRDVITLEAQESLLLAQDIMELGRIRHLPVVDGRRLVGLVTHRDLLSASLSSLEACAAEDESRKSHIFVRDVMRRDVRTVGPDTPAIEAARVMVEHKFGCLPVVDSDHRLVGILSEADFLRLAARLLEEEEQRLS